MNGSTTIEYVTAGSLRVAQVSSFSGTSYFLPDHLGSTNILSDTSGSLVRTDQYLPFGSMYATSGSKDSDYKFTGQRNDDTTGLYYYGARYYDPLLGRFITPDTVVQAPYDPQTLNRYAYCRNNPVILMDPSGHSFFGDLLGAVSIAINPYNAMLNVAAHAAFGQVNNFHDAMRYSYQGEVIGYGIGGAVGLGMVAGPAMFPGGFQAGISGSSILLAGAGYGCSQADNCHDGRSDRPEDGAPRDREMGVSFRGGLSDPNDFEQIYPQFAGPGSADPTWRRKDSSTASLFLAIAKGASAVSLGSNYAGAAALGASLAIDGVGEVADKALAIHAGVYDAIAGASYYAHYQLTGNNESQQKAFISMISIPAEILGTNAVSAYMKTVGYSATGVIFKSDLLQFGNGVYDLFKK